MNFEDLPKWKQDELLKESHALPFPLMIGGRAVYPDPRVWDCAMPGRIERIKHWWSQ